MVIATGSPSPLTRNICVINLGPVNDVIGHHFRLTGPPAVMISQMYSAPVLSQLAVMWWCEDIYVRISVSAIYWSRISQYCGVRRRLLIICGTEVRVTIAGDWRKSPWPIRRTWTSIRKLYQRWKMVIHVAVELQVAIHLRIVNPVSLFYHVICFLIMIKIRVKAQPVYPFRSYWQELLYLYRPSLLYLP